jgi:hypothetical protein
VTLAVWISLGGVLLTIVGHAINYGMLRGQVGALSDRIAQLASKESVTSAEGRIRDLEAEMQELRKLATSVEVMRAEMAGFRDLYNRDAEEMKHGIRGLKQALEGFSSLPRARRKPPTD